MSITQITNPPSTQDPENFDPRADNLFDVQLPRFIDEINIEIPIINQNAIDTAANAVIASESAIIAAGAANYKGDYSAMVLYAIGESVSYLGRQYIKKSTAAAGTTPVNGVDWLEIYRVPDPALTPGFLQSIGGEYVIQELGKVTEYPSVFVSSQPALKTTALSDVGINGFEIVALDANRDLILFSRSPAGIEAVVYDHSTGLFGNFVAVRIGNLLGYASLVEANKVLVVTCTSNSTALEAVVLSISGSVITVGTATAQNLAQNSNFDFTSANGLLKYGSSFAAMYYGVATSVPYLIGFSVSGTTVTIGNQVSLNGNTSSSFQQQKISETQGLVFTFDTGTGAIFARPYTIAGTAIALGTQQTIAAGGSPNFISYAFPSGRVALFYGNGTNFGRILSVAANVITLGAEQTVSTGDIQSGVATPAGKCIVWSGNTQYLNIVQDGITTLTIGTQYNAGTNSRTQINGFDFQNNFVFSADTAAAQKYIFDISGNSPILKRSFSGISNSNTAAIALTNGFAQLRVPIGNYQRSSTSRTKNGLAVSYTSSTTLPFVETLTSTTASFSFNRAYRGINYAPLRNLEYFYSFNLLEDNLVILRRVDIDA